MVLGAVYRSPGIYLKAEGNPRKPLLRVLMKVMQPAIASNGVPYLQLRSIGLHSTSGKGERRKVR
jgi:hypothetical protein